MGGRQLLMLLAVGGLIFLLAGLGAALVNGPATGAEPAGTVVAPQQPSSPLSQMFLLRDFRSKFHRM